MDHPLDGVRLKLVRAEEHLKTIFQILDGFSIGKCEIIAEEDKNTNSGLLRVHLPKPDPQLRVIAGDFCYNVRSALDHLVWQLVIANPPHAPNRNNAFPICSSQANFNDAKRRHRLDGVSAEAITLIDSFQPYPGRKQALLTLSTIHDTDKHQTLNIVTAVASDTAVEWYGDTSYFGFFLGSEELRDGAVFGDIALPFTEEMVSFLGKGETLSAFRDRFLKAKMEGEAAIFVAFDKAGAEELEPLRVDTVLQEILDHIGQNIIPAFEPFFN